MDWWLYKRGTTWISFQPFFSTLYFIHNDTGASWRGEIIWIWYAIVFIVHSQKDELPGISGIRRILAIAPIRPRIALRPVVYLMTMALRCPLNWETIHSVKRWHRKTAKLVQSYVNCISMVQRRHIMVIAVPLAGILTYRHEPLPLLELFSAWISAPSHQPILGIVNQYVSLSVTTYSGEKVLPALLTFSKTSFGLRIMSPGVGSSFFVERLTLPLSRSWLSIIT